MTDPGAPPLNLPVIAARAFGELEWSEPCSDCQALLRALRETRAALSEVMGLADDAMREANNDGAEYDRAEELRYARDVLGRVDD